MAFNNPRDVDASGSVFVDGTQGHLQIVTVHNYNHCDFRSTRGSALNLPTEIHRRPATPQHNRSIPTSYPAPSDSGLAETPLESLFTDTASLISDVVTLLCGNNTPRRTCDYLINELEQTKLILLLTERFFRLFGESPLARSLSITLHPEVAKCHTILQKTHDNIHCYRDNLHKTSVRSVFLLIWWYGWGEGKLPWLREQLYILRHSFASFLRALNSVKWETLGNMMISGELTSSEIRSSLRLIPSSLQHVPFASVTVIDYLGKHILVPKVFCSNWDGLQHIIKSHCRNRAGDRYIQQCAYQVIGHNGEYHITQENISTMVDKLDTLEISIILIQIAAYGNEKKCYRCNFVNDRVGTQNGWIECSYCSVWFQTTKIDLQIRKEDFDTRKVVAKPTAPAVQIQETEIDDTRFLRRVSLIHVDKSPLVDSRMCRDLNNFLQVRYGMAIVLTWENTLKGPSDCPIWTSVAFLNGIEYGRGTGNTKRRAKEIAAAQVLSTIDEGS